MEIRETAIFGNGKKKNKGKIRGKKEIRGIVIFGKGKRQETKPGKPWFRAEANSHHPLFHTWLGFYSCI